ncbi:MAG TPA: type II secretion system protein [Candidatus Margulisiibacteriota bacterium]|nr:type II secretion system protein [Candidatus Margulisiibacteriota bacterium]
MKCKVRKSERGFTLVETLASLGVFALAAGAIGSLLVTQTRLETSNALATTVTSLAAKELEDLRSLDYGSIPGSRTSTTTIANVKYTVTSTATFDTPGPQMASITTTVSWTEPSGSKTYTVNAIYTDVTR